MGSPSGMGTAERGRPPGTAEFSTLSTTLSPETPRATPELSTRASEGCRRIVHMGAFLWMVCERVGIPDIHRHPLSSTTFPSRIPSFLQMGPCPQGERTAVWGRNMRFAWFERKPERNGVVQPNGWLLLSSGVAVSATPCRSGNGRDVRSQPKTKIDHGLRWNQASRTGMIRATGGRAGRPSFADAAVCLPEIRGPHR